jgi:excisionase family DNA binding protein
MPSLQFPPERLLLTPREAALALAISERKLWSLTAAQEVSCVRIGRSVRYRPKALTDYLSACEQRGRP